MESIYMTTLELSPEVHGMPETFPSPPSPHARPLRYRLHDKPLTGGLLDYTEAWIERDLCRLWDDLRDPAWAVAAWEAGIGTLRTADLLDAVLDASDAAADAELRQSGAVRAREVYADALHELATAILGVQR